jgi:hypothetical protein
MPREATNSETDGVNGMVRRLRRLELASKPLMNHHASELLRLIDIRLLKAGGTRGGASTAGYRSVVDVLQAGRDRARTRAE